MFYGINKAVDNAVKEIKKGQRGERIVFPTGWSRLNNQLLGGLQKGKLYVVGGRPGVMKSTFSNQLIFDVMDNCKEKPKNVLVLYWNFEMPGYQQLLRVASGGIGISYREALSIDSVLNASKFNAITKELQRFRSYNVIFCDIPKTVDDIRSGITHFAKEAGPNTTIINVFDHSRLVKKHNERNELDRLVNLSSMCMETQAEFGVINILLSQLNRKIESDERAKTQFQPRLSDLFGSDSIGQDAHVVMMLNRPHALYGITDTYCGIDPVDKLFVHVEKNREGALGVLVLDTNFPSFLLTE